jgi:AbrB family looped-hinge helix DNA binding protein
MQYAYTITRKGQRTLPKEIREKLGLKAGTCVSIAVDEVTQILQLRRVKDIVDLAGTLKTHTPMDLNRLRVRVARHDERQ